MAGKRFKRVAVLLGGLSSEREISLKSGLAVASGLREAGYSVREIVLDRKLNIPGGVEAVFIALHGAYGEDGGVQADLDRLGLPYTGSGAAASRLAFDKVATKRMLAARGIPTPEYRVLAPGDDSLPLPPPVVLKPPRDGSSFGVEWVFRQEEWLPALQRSREYSRDLLLEAFVPGRELTVGVVDGQSLPVIEIVAPGGRYDPSAKYSQGQTVYHVLDDREDGFCGDCRSQAMAVFSLLGARGVGRVDFRLSPEGTAYVLELNTIPGFTQTSLLPKAARAAGIGFAQLCSRIMETASCDDSPRQGSKPPT